MSIAGNAKHAPIYLEVVPPLGNHWTVSSHDCVSSFTKPTAGVALEAGSCSVFVIYDLVAIVKLWVSGC